MAYVWAYAQARAEACVANDIKYKAPRIRFRIDFGPGVAVGPGKVALLEQIADRRSLSRAARELGMSYRAAWLLLQSLNASFADPVAIGKKGGDERGGTLVTPLGEELIRRYRKFERQIQELAACAFGALARRRSRKRPAKPRAKVDRLKAPRLSRVDAPASVRR